MKKEKIGDDNLINLVGEVEILTNEDKTFKDMKKISDEIEKLEETVNKFTSENDTKNLKTEIPDKWS